RRPQNSVVFEKCMLLVGRDHLIVRLIRIMTDRFKRSLQSSKTASLTYGIGIMLNSKAECQRQPRLQPPFIFSVNSQIKEGYWNARLRSERLRQQCEVRGRRRRIDTTLIKGVQRDRSQLPSGIHIVR